MVEDRQPQGGSARLGEATRVGKFSEQNRGTSKERHHASGVRYCFEHTPAGAVFAAANAAVQGSDPTVSANWVKYAIGEGPFRAQVLAESGTASSSNPRMSIAGFRLLSYNGRTAEVDIAIRTAVGATTVTASGVYMLVWQGGDWKLSADVAKPLDVAPIPDLAGYVFWGA